ncbi:MAG: EAL domain-containing protein [Actinobacteria bacterium]|nr:EAL domain-containing protein [Actinomycetota bacterium]
MALPLIAWIILSYARDPLEFGTPLFLVWIAAIAVVDLMPVPTSLELNFSLSFPLQLAVALIYPPPVAAAIALLGTSDKRELRRELPLAKSLFIRAQIALSVLVEGLVFHRIAVDLKANWWILCSAVLLATLLGYAVNALLVAWYFHLESRQRLGAILRDMHVGVFGEFLVSYLGLALFSVLVATSFVENGILAVGVFIAPLAFAWQMFHRTHSLQVATDELAEREREKEHQAMHDALTGLPNRTLFQHRLQEAIADAERDGTALGVMIMDLDHFKEINDTLDHHYGDLLLQEIGPRLSSVLRPEDLMARLGGDEFGVVLPELSEDHIAIRVAERLIEEMEHPVVVEGIALDVSASIGIATFPLHSDDVETLLRRADVAMYAAKESGGGYEVYSSALDKNSPSRLTLIGQVRPAIDNEEFFLHYQPKARLADGRVTGVEALIRWQHPERGLVPPDEFIPLVERTVLLRPLTQFVLDEALRQWHQWSHAGIQLEVAVNLSPRSLLDPQLPDVVGQFLERWGVPPRFLTLELTESFLMSDSGRSLGVLAELSNIGVMLSIDDFGTGYSSLSYLKRLPIGEIKIDRSFVMNMHESANDAMIVRATVELGRNLGLRVVAEGVETQDAWDQLAELRCDVAQGYFLCRPIPAKALTDWITAREPARDAPASGRADQEPGDAPEAGRGHLRAI